MRGKSSSLIPFLRRYARLYRVFARNNLVREMEFRGNFWAKVVTNVGWLLLYVLLIKILFANTRSVAGWNEGEMFLLLGTFMLTRALMDILFTQNLGQIPELVRMGTMDFVLTKPVPSQFFVSARYVSLDEVGSLVGAGAILAYGLSGAGITPTAAQIAAWGFLVLCGLALFYAIQLLLMTLSFWLIRLDNLTALTDTVVFIARYPPDIFGKYLAWFFTYLLPLAFLAAVPTLALKEGVRGYWLLTGALITAIFLTATALFWRYATRVYTSASS
jgi:ABC-2 type transport system permease protein